MTREYNHIIEQHYQTVAQEHGLSSTSTMADEITRRLETDAILRSVAVSRSLRQAEKGSEPVIMDVGCGNGYTLDVLLKKYPDHTLVGVENSDALWSLAVSRFRGYDNVTIIKGDIRDPSFNKGIAPDILICQRLLINLLDIEDQRLGLTNMINAVASPKSERAGGTLLFLECFSGPLAKLNEARSELDLPPISPAYHNLYLPDDFFETPRLKPINTDSRLPPATFLSTNYFVTRVLHPFFTQGKPLKRNSEFVRFFCEALKEHVGDYSPLKLYVFEKSGHE